MISKRIVLLYRDIIWSSEEGNNEFIFSMGSKARGISATPQLFLVWDPKGLTSRPWRDASRHPPFGWEALNDEFPLEFP
jgi:hypothetical protein